MLSRGFWLSMHLDTETAALPWVRRKKCSSNRAVCFLNGQTDIRNYAETVLLYM